MGSGKVPSVLGYTAPVKELCAFTSSRRSPKQLTIAENRYTGTAAAHGRLIGMLGLLSSGSRLHHFIKEVDMVQMHISYMQAGHAHEHQYD